MKNSTDKKINVSSKEGILEKDVKKIKSIRDLERDLSDGQVKKPTIAFELELRGSVIDTDFEVNGIKEGEKIGTIYYKNKDGMISVDLVNEDCKKIEFIINPVLTNDMRGIEILQNQTDMVTKFVKYLENESNTKDIDEKYDKDNYKKLAAISKKIWEARNKLEESINQNSRSIINNDIEELQQEFNEISNYDFKRGKEYSFAKDMYFTPRFDFSLEVSFLDQKFDCVQTNIMLPLSSLYNDAPHFADKINNSDTTKYMKYSEPSHAIVKKSVDELLKDEVLNDDNFNEISGIMTTVLKGLVDSIITHYNLEKRSNKEDPIFLPKNGTYKNLELHGLPRLNKDDRITLWKFTESFVGKKKLNQFVVHFLENFPNELENYTLDNKQIEAFRTVISNFLEKNNNDIVNTMINGIPYNSIRQLYDSQHIEDKYCENGKFKMYEKGCVTFPLNKVSDKNAIVTEFRLCPPSNDKSLFSDLSKIYKKASHIFNSKNIDDIGINYGGSSDRSLSIDKPLIKQKSLDDSHINHGLRHLGRGETSFSKYQTKTKNIEKNLKPGTSVTHTVCKPLTQQELKQDEEQVKKGCCYCF